MFKKNALRAGYKKRIISWKNEKIHSIEAREINKKYIKTLVIIFFFINFIIYLFYKSIFIYLIKGALMKLVIKRPTLKIFTNYLHQAFIEEIRRAESLKRRKNLILSKQKKY